MNCGWCRSELPATAGRSAKYCDQRCRQSAWRARKYYGREDSFAGEVDHAALIARLEAGGYLGWALSASEDSLREILPLCPEGARICPWTKPIGVSSRTRGLHNAWEPLIVVGGRQRRPGRRDWLCAQPARFGGELAGRKPLGFCTWMFGLLGMQRGDELDDLFPGTGIVTRAWEAVSRGAPGDASRAAPSDGRRLVS